jgi:hypothetical protein
MYQFLGYKSNLKSCDYQAHPAVNMVSYKKCFQSEKEIEQMLHESGSEGEVFSESENSCESESVSDSESESEDSAEESEVDNLDPSNSDGTVPPSPKRAKEEGWKWSVTGERPSKFHFIGNPGIKTDIIRNLPPEPNPLHVFHLMVHDSL